MQTNSQKQAKIGSLADILRGNQSPHSKVKNDNLSEIEAILNFKPKLNSKSSQKFLEIPSAPSKSHSQQKSDSSNNYNSNATTAVPSPNPPI